MFEIGNSLREARIRQGLELADAEQATKIRRKYLAGLEEERFEVLPAQTYVKGFLRSYAEFLGLDGQIYVDEYNSRFFTGDDDAPYRAKRVRRPTPQHRRVESSVLLIALAGITAATALVIVAWRYGGDEPRRNTIPNLPSASPPAAIAPQPATAPAIAPSRRWVSLVVTAIDGNSLLLARRGGPSGKVIWDGTLEKGRSLSLVGPEIWLNLGAPRNVIATIDGKPAALGVSGSQPAVLLATRAGFISASAG